MPDVIRVKQVENLTQKSFRNYTGPTDEFQRSNIFFAPNGSGKTSLAIGIKNQFLKTSDESRLRIYNRGFIASQLLLEEDGNIRGVKADFGKKDVDLEQKIKEQESERSDLEAAIAHLEVENTTLITTTETAIEDIFKRRKGKASIAKKTHKEGVHEKVVQLWIDDYHAALKKFPNENYDGIDGEKSFGDTLDVINGLKFDAPSLPSNEELIVMNSILQKTYTDVDIPSSEILAWLEEGLHLHEDKENCEFCGSSININDLSDKINAYTQDERTLARKRLEAIRAQLDLAWQQLTVMTTTRDAILATLEKDEVAVKAFDDLEKQIKPLDEAAKVIAVKIDDMSQLTEIDIDNLTAQLDVIKAGFASLVKSKESIKKLYEDKINRLEILVKGAIGYEVKNSLLIAENVTTYDTNLKELARLRKQSGTKRETIRKLRESKSDLADFANYLNTIFEEIGINFKLILASESYVLQHSLSGVDLQMNDISEGERNLLALVYFYYEMLGSDLKSLKDTIEIVIIDDAATSMDDENRFYILELVKSIISNKNIQSFVLSHSWRDFCDLCYARNEDQGVRRFEILKTGGVSSVALSKSVVMPYKKLYKEVYDFSQKVVTDVNADEALHMPNNMRRVLEEYIRFNFGIDLATQTRYNEIAEVLFEEDVANVSANNEAKLRKLLSVCNILSHGAPHTRSVAEIHSSARFLVNRMSVINKYHHDRMKQS